MPYREIICLANSTKMGGKCVAGKEVASKKWLRPISDATTGELSEDQIRYEDRTIPKLLDIIKIAYSKNCPIFCQPENILISEGQWAKTGEFDKKKIKDLCDYPKDIWLIGDYQDKISADILKEEPVKSSLLLIQVDSFKIKVDEVSYPDRGGIVTKKKVRAIFNYNRQEYNFGITDPTFHSRYSKSKSGIHKLDAANIYLCLSLAEPFERDNFCYKLVASIITW